AAAGNIKDPAGQRLLHACADRVVACWGDLIAHLRRHKKPPANVTDPHLAALVRDPAGQACRLECWVSFLVYLSEGKWTGSEETARGSFPQLQERTQGGWPRARGHSTEEEEEPGALPRDWTVELFRTPAALASQQPPAPRRDEAAVEPEKSDRATADEQA